MSVHAPDSREDGGNVSRLRGMFEQIAVNEGKKTEPITTKSKAEELKAKADVTARTVINDSKDNRTPTASVPSLRRLGERKKFTLPLQAAPQPKPADPPARAKGKEKVLQKEPEYPSRVLIKEKRVSETKSPLISQNQKFSTTVSRIPIASNPIWSRLKPTQDKEDQINALSLKLNGLRNKQRMARMGLDGRGIDSFNEEVFQRTKELHNLKKSLNENDPPILHEKVKNMESTLQPYNRDLPKMEDVEKLGLTTASLSEAVDQILQDKAMDRTLEGFPYTPEELARDANLMGLTPLQMKEKYCEIASRESLVPAIKLHSLSVVSRVEHVRQESKAKGLTHAHEAKIGDHQYAVVFPGKEGGIFIKQKFINDGTFKAVFGLSAFKLKTPFTSKRKLTIAQPKTAVQEQLKETEKYKALAMFEAQEKAKAEAKKLGSLKQKKGLGDEVEEKNSGTAHDAYIFNTGDFSDEESESLGVGKDAFIFNTGDFSDEEGSLGDVKTARNVGDDVEVYDSGNFSNDEGFAIEDEGSTGGNVIKGLDFENVQLYEDINISESEKFEREIKMHKEVSDLNLPGVLKVLMIGRTEKKDIFLVLEETSFKLDSRETPVNDLAQMVYLNSGEDEKPLPIHHQIDMLEMLCDSGDGLAALHQKGYIHRDFKPGNVLTSDIKDEHGKRGLVADFGCMIYDGAPRNTLIEGTPGFISPEVGMKIPLTTKVDVWAFGISIWQMTSGFSPSDHPSLRDIRGESIDAQATGIGKLLSQEKVRSEYEKQYPEPEEKNSFAHLAWECTRAKPEDRPTMEQATARLREITAATQEKMIHQEKAYEDKLKTGSLGPTDFQPHVFQYFGSYPPGYME